MKVRRQKELIKSVARRWKGQWFNSDTNKWISYFGAPKDHGEIYQQLKALHLKTATVEDIELIMGDREWISYFCESCHENKADAVQTYEHDDESEDEFVCFDCIKEMSILVKDAEAENAS